jgi:hypothetical protein
MRRHVFYIHGFDPRGPAPYHAICAEAAREHGIEITPRRKAGPLSAVWGLRGPDCDVIYEFLRYDDLVRGLWPRWNGYRRHLAAWRVLHGYARAGVLGALARHARPTLFAIVAQALNSLAQLAFALALGAVGWRIADVFVHEPLALAGWLAAGAAPPICRRLEAKASAAWFTRSLAYLMESARGEIDVTAERAGAFALRLVEVWRSGEADEIVVIGHSAGAAVAVETLCAALRMAPELSRQQLCLLTLGQAIPVYAQLEPTGAFLSKVATVAAAVRFIDVTSPKDPASSGVMPIVEGVRGRIDSRSTGHIDASVPLWNRTLRPLEFHFQYLRAHDPGLGFDYVTTLTAGASIPAARDLAA